MRPISFLLFAPLLISTALLGGCGRQDPPSDPAADDPAPEVLDGGLRIRLHLRGTDQIQVDSVAVRPVTVELKAPCRVVMSAVPSSTGTLPVFLFDSNELSEVVTGFMTTRVQLEKAKKQVERLRDLVSHQAAPGKDLLDAEAEYAQLRTALAENESKIRLAGLDVEHALAIGSGSILLLADIPETQLRLIHAGNPARILLNSFPTDPFVGKILSVGNVVDPVTRSVKVQVVIPNKEGRLLAGMYGQMILGVQEQIAAAIPSSSVFTALGKSFVFVQSGEGEFERREVVPGMQGGDWIEILSGVRRGERVVFKGAMLLKGLSFGY